MYIRRIVIALLLIAPCVSCAQSEPWRTHFHVLNDTTATSEERSNAYQILSEVRDPALILAVFELLGEPIGSFRRANPGPISESETPARRAGWEVRDLRLRLFRRLFISTEPEADRARLAAQLLDVSHDTFQLLYIVLNSRYAWSEEVRERLFRVFSNTELRETFPDENHALNARVVSAFYLLDPSLGHIVEEYQGPIVTTLWKERGTMLAHSVAHKLDYAEDDPRSAILWIERWQQSLQQASGRSKGDKEYQAMVSRAREFERAVWDMTEGKEIGDVEEVEDRRNDRLATGDERKAQWTRLEERLARIEEWIAENLPRLERAAEEYRPSDG